MVFARIEQYDEPMANMRFSVCIVYWIAIQSTLIGSIAGAVDRRADDENITDLEPIRDQRLTLMQLDSIWPIDESARSKRNEEIGDEPVLTRHGKHRKRRRCRNRSTCLRNTTATRLHLSRGDRAPVNETSNQSKSGANATVAGIDDRLQDSRTDSKGKGHEITESAGDNDGIVSERNVSVNEDSSDLETTDSPDERPTASEMEPVGANRSLEAKDQSRKDEVGDGDDYTDEEPAAMYSAMDEQFTVPDSLSALLSKLFQSLRNTSTTNEQDIFKDLNFVNGTSEDPCQKWLNSKEKFDEVFLGGLTSLPGCPCQYPSNIFYDDKIWDEKRKKHFRWRDVSGESQRLDVYKPGAAYCIRSLLTQGTGSAAAQHCCYDRDRKLLTRGSGAGTPNFVSPEISSILHEKIDVLPWRLCKGDFSRYNEVRPPNNENNCETNPDDEEYQRQIDSTNVSSHVLCTASQRERGEAAANPGTSKPI